MKAKLFIVTGLLFCAFAYERVAAGEFETITLPYAQASWFSFRFDHETGQTSQLYNGSWYPLGETGSRPSQADYQLRVNTMKGARSWMAVRFVSQTGQAWKVVDNAWKPIDESSSLQNGNYEIYMEAQEGNYYTALRLNQATGQSWRLNGDRWEALTDNISLPSGDYEIKLISAFGVISWSALRFERNSGQSWYVEGTSWVKIDDPSPASGSGYTLAITPCRNGGFAAVRTLQSSGQSWYMGDGKWNAIGLATSTTQPAALASPRRFDLPVNDYGNEPLNQHVPRRESTTNLTADTTPLVAASSDGHSLLGRWKGIGLELEFDELGQMRITKGGQVERGRFSFNAEKNSLTETMRSGVSTGTIRWLSPNTISYLRNGKAVLLQRQ